MAIDAIGDTAVAARRLLVPVDAHLERHDRPLGRERDARLVPPIDEADRHVEEEIDHPERRAFLRAGDEPPQCHGELRPDAVEARHRAEEGVQDFRPHFACSRPLGYRIVPFPSIATPPLTFRPRPAISTPPSDGPETARRRLSIAEAGMTGGTETGEADLAMRRRRLRFRVWHRGMREVDLILGRFADAHLAELDEADLSSFEALLGE